MLKNNVVILSALTVSFIASSAFAGSAVINFEGLGSEGDPVASMSLPGVTVMFLTEDDAGTQYVPTLAEVGAPRVGFQSTVGDDTPRGGNGGRFSLTDGIRRTRDYIIMFSQPIEGLSLDLYDFRADGPHILGTPGSDTVSLDLFDAADVLVGSDSYTVPSIRPADGNVVTLGNASVSGIRKARLVFNTIEGGTAIDNIMFTVVPEPSSLGLVTFGFVGLLGMRRRRRAA